MKRFDRTTKIKNDVDLLLFQRDQRARKALGDLIHLIYTLTVEDRIDGESAFFDAITQIFINDQLDGEVMNRWIERNKWTTK